MLHNGHGMSCPENQSLIMFLALQVTSDRQSQHAVQEGIFREVLLQYLPHEGFVGAKAQQEGSWLH